MLTEWKAAVLRHTPPTDEFLAAGQYAMAPAAGAALVVFALALLLFGKRVAVPAAATALVVGFGLANYYRSVFPWWPAGQPWHWIPLLFLLAQVDGVLGQSGTPWWGRWRLRIGLGLLAALILVPPDLHHKWPLLGPSGRTRFRPAPGRSLLSPSRSSSAGQDRKPWPDSHRAARSGSACRWPCLGRRLSWPTPTVLGSPTR